MSRRGEPIEFTRHFVFAIEEVDAYDIPPEDGSDVMQYELERIPQAAQRLL